MLGYKGTSKRNYSVQYRSFLHGTFSLSLALEVPAMGH